MPARRLAWTFAAMALLCAPSAADAQPSTQKRVLVVYSTRRDTQLPIFGDREFPKRLAQGLSAKPDYYSEHIDAARFPDAQYRAAFRNYLRLKYSGAHFDLIIAMHRMAYDIIAPARDQLFAGTPIVFVTQDPNLVRVPNSAKVVAVPDYGRTIGLATTLQPDTTQVFVISGSSPRDVAMRDTARQQFASMGRGLTFTYLGDESTEALERRLSSLPEHSIVYYLIVYQDAEGANLNPLDYLSRLSTISNRPVYSWVESTMDSGVVGGSLVSFDRYVAAVSSVASRVLHGEAADSIPVSTIDPHVNQVDWRQLRRWNIPDTRVPQGTLVRFREPTRWERDRSLIVGGAAIVAVETALIGALIFEALRRRRAEADARAATGALRASFDRIRDLGGRLLTAQEAERARIGRELHDDVSQQLTLLAIDLDLLARTDPEDQAEERDRLSRGARTRVQSLAATVHQLSHQLHPAKLRIIGLPAALAALQHEVRASGHHVTFQYENVPAGLPQDVMLCIYRIAQESLQNAIKHSGAGSILISLKGGEGTLTLSVVDDGVGFEVNEAEFKGLGLISMNERLEPLGGSLRIESSPRRGTQIRAVVPLPIAAVSRAETA